MYFMMITLLFPLTEPLGDLSHFLRSSPWEPNGVHGGKGCESVRASLRLQLSGNSHLQISLQVIKFHISVLGKISAVSLWLCLSLQISE